MDFTNRTRLQTPPSIFFSAEPRLQERRKEEIVAERQKLAREIHDGIVQELVALVFQVRDIKPVDPGANDTAYRHAEALAARCLAAARKLMRELRDVDGRPTPAPGQMCLEAALRGALRDVLRDSGIPLQIACAAPVSVDPRVGHEVLKIAREAAINSIRHSKAKTIRCSVTQHRQRIVMRLVDDGVGFNLLNPRNGFGILGMQERALEFGGRLSIRSSVGLGCEVTLTFDRRRFSPNIQPPIARPSLVRLPILSVEKE